VVVTRYARSNGVNIAYQVVGDGPRDLVYVPGWISNVEVMWEEPAMARFLERLSQFSRLILFDKRGTGLSDPVAVDALPGLDERMDDLRAVMDAVDSRSATLLGHSEGGNMCILFAATYPARTEGLILAGCYAKRVWSPDYPWAPTPAQRAADIEETERTYGDPDQLPTWLAPSRMGDERFRNWLARYMRLGASPRAAAHLLEMNTLIDTTNVLPSIQVPTLGLYRSEDQDVSVEEGRWVADRIPGAVFVEIPGADHLLNAAGSEEMLAEIEEFMTGRRSTIPSERALATVLFTDIVGSTERASAAGDRRWKELLEEHHRRVRGQLARFRGTEVDTAGDGFFATFDGPARAVRCARSIVDSVASLGIEVRAGVHTGEVETIDGKVGGMAVVIGARVGALAGSSEVLVSQTVKDLTAGSGLAFEDAGERELKGVPDRWRLYRAVN